MGRGVRVDKFNIVSLDSKRLLKGNNRFILARQASQVFYCNEVACKVGLLLSKCNLEMHMTFQCPLRMKSRLRITQWYPIKC